MSTPTAEQHDNLTPEQRGLLVSLAFPIDNRQGQSYALERMVAEQISAALTAKDAEIERLRKTAASHEAQLVRIAALFGKDARHAEDGTIAGMVEAEVAELRAQIVGHCDRIAKQSDALSRRAEVVKPPQEQP